MLITEIVASSAVSIGFAGYMNAVFGTPVMPIALLLLIGLTVVASAGARYWMRLNAVLSILAILGLLVVIASGINKVGSMQYVPPQGGRAGIISASILVFFAYIGFDNMSNIAEDTKEPEKTIPMGLIIAVVVTTALYVLVGVSALSLVPVSVLSESDAPLAVAASSVLGEAGFYIISAIALLTTMNTVQVLIIVSSRIIYGMGKEQALPAVFGRINKKTNTPVFALAAVLLIALAFLPLSSASAIAKVTSFGSLVTFSLVNVASLHLRRVAPDVKRPFKAPLNIGWFSVTAALGLFFCILLLLQFDMESFLLGLLIPMSGFIVYFVTSRSIVSHPIELHEPHTRFNN